MSNLLVPPRVPLIETLEGRRLYDGTVSETAPGYFQIDGDDNANTITVSVDQSVQTFTVDGTTYSDVSFVYIVGNGGDDTITVTTVGEAGMVAASVDAGDGNDTVKLSMDGGAWGGAGNDVIYLSNSYRGEAHGGAGDDQMYVTGACINPQLYGDEGADRIDGSQSQYGIDASGGDGNDSLTGSSFNDTLFGDGGRDVILAGAGNDSIFADDDCSDQILGGAGNDTLYTGGATDWVISVEHIVYIS